MTLWAWDLDADEAPVAAPVQEEVTASELTDLDLSDFELSEGDQVDFDLDDLDLDLDEVPVQSEAASDATAAFSDEGGSQSRKCPE